MIDYIWAQ